MKVDPPQQVRRALTLLWVTVALGVIDLATSIWTSPPDAALGRDWLIIAFYLLLTAFMIYYAAEGRNWARVLILACTVLVAGQFFFVALRTMIEWPYLVGSSLITGLNVLATIWLFTGDSAKWYASSIGDHDGAL